MAAPYPSSGLSVNDLSRPEGPFENDHQEQRMSDASSVARNLRERLSGSTEERLGKALSDLLENPLLTGAIGRVFDAREKAAQAQEVAMGALNIPSAADIERLTRRLRSVSQRLEGIEDGVHRLDRVLSPSVVEARLSAIEDQLGALSKNLGGQPQASAAPPATVTVRPGRSAAPTGGRGTEGRARPKAVKAKPKTGKAKSGTGRAQSSRAKA